MVERTVETKPSMTISATTFHSVSVTSLSQLCNCRANGIRCVMTWSDRRRLDDPALRDNPALAPLIALLDRLCLCDFAIRDPDILIDAAADGRHPGPATNAAFAARLIEFHARALEPSS